MTLSNLIDDANASVIEKMLNSEVYLMGMEKASNVIPFLSEGYAMTHSGPPVEWADMCSAMKQSIVGAVVYEGWTNDYGEAEEMAQSGAIRFASNNDIGCVAPMAGIISPSMPVFVFKNKTYGNMAHVNLNEGLGKTLRFGANDASVIDRLKWMERVLAPILADAIELSGPINITSMTARGVQRGDDGHNRNKACTGLFIRYVAPWMVRTDHPKNDIADALAFIDSNDHFFLNLSIGNCKATMDSIGFVKNSSVVTCMSTNGHSFGIQIAGCGDEWFLAPSPYAIGNYFKGYSDADAIPTMGDSYITETTGIGAFAMAAALGIGQFIGIDTEQAQQFSKDMYQITLTEHSRYLIPVFNYRGTPTGIDVRKVVASGSLPIINTGIAHREPGVGQIGAGYFHPPMDCFKKALLALEQGA